MQPLARALRPKTFSEVWGHQDRVEAIKKILFPLRHHTFLISGTRGLGKTTLARLIGQALSCQEAQAPCGLCESCVQIHQGRHVDFIEIDAATKTKVEDIRDIIQSSQCAPLESPYKVYLFDEAHMLSGHSFNALLKAFEEPPAHVVYILATTEPHKILPTVRSRCLNFHLQTPSFQEMKSFLECLAKNQSVESNSDVLDALALRAQGSYRDALNLFQHATILGEGSLNHFLVKEFLSVQGQQFWTNFFKALREQDLSQLSTLTKEVLQKTPVLVFHQMILEKALEHGLNLEEKSALYLILSEAYRLGSSHPYLEELSLMLLIQASLSLQNEKKKI